MPWLVGDRPAGVAVVVADHEAPCARQRPAEALIPPQHRRPDALDEKYRPICRIAERLRAELHAVDLDYLFGHVATSLLADRVRDSRGCAAYFIRPDQTPRTHRPRH